jgi:integrase
MPKLTKTIVERTEIKEKPYFLFDEQLPGFCLRVAPNGKRHYHLQYLKNKKVRRIALGLHGIVTAEGAREKAIALLASINAGGDPVEEKMQRNSEPTIQELSERYLDEHVDVHCKKRTADGYRYYLKRHILPEFGNAKVSDVTRKDLAAFHHTLRKTPYEANRCLEILSKMFNLAELWGLRPDGTNPRRHLKKFQEYSRERYLTKEEAKSLGKLLTEVKKDEDENLSAAYCIELLLYTGCRLGEIQTLKWAYVDRDNSCLRLPDSKTGARVVYVGGHVIQLLNEIEKHDRRPKDNPYVIWGEIEGAHIKNLKRPWQRWRKKAGLEDMRIHDLRHSFASYAVSEGMSLPMLGKLLGHTQVQTTARYAHLMADPMREAAAKVSQHIAAAMNSGAL